MDLSAVVEDRRHVLLMSENGGLLFTASNDSGTAFELHTFFLKAGRGEEVHDAARDAFEWMFTKTPALRIYTMTPEDCPHAKPPLSFGWRPYFSRGDLFTRNGKRIGAQYWRLDIWDWAAKQKRLNGLNEIVWAVGLLFPDKAKRMADEWQEWSGEVLKCQ